MAARALPPSGDMGCAAGGPEPGRALLFRLVLARQGGVGCWGDWYPLDQQEKMTRADGVTEGVCACSDKFGEAPPRAQHWRQWAPGLELHWRLPALVIRFLQEGLVPQEVL